MYIDEKGRLPPGELYRIIDAMTDGEPNPGHGYIGRVITADGSEVNTGDGWYSLGTVSRFRLEMFY